MHNATVLRKLGKVLLVEPDPVKAQLKVDFLTSEGTSVDVVEHEFQILIYFGDLNHGYNLVFFGNRPLYPDAAKRMVLEQMDLLD